MIRQAQSEFGKGAFSEELFRLTAHSLRHRIRAPIDIGAIERILVLQLQQLGDSVVFTPTLRAIRARFPSARLDLLCSPVSYELYSKAAHVDRLLRADWLSHPVRRLPAALRQLWQLRRERYDLAVVDVTQISARYPIIAYLSGARNRIGFDVDDRGFLFTSPIQRPEDEDFIRCNLRIAAALGADISDDSAEAYFDSDDRAFVDRLLYDQRRQCLIVIHPASNWQSKTWFPERWASIAKRLSDAHRATIAFVGAAKERSYIEDIRSRTDTPTLSLVGKTSIGQLAALLASCDLFVGTDSGPRHLAAGAKCPRVTLMSAQDRSSRWQFADPNEIVLRTSPECSPCFQSYCSHRSCMAAIAEQHVADAARVLLTRTAASQRHKAIVQSTCRPTPAAQERLR